MFLYVPHTTAGLTINENADPAVLHDVTGKLGRMVPAADGYTHAEGNSDAHVKTSLFGSELFIFVEDGELQLGTWQGIYFCEFDGPRNRELYYKFI
jgi:secondary thiamine-phosphate synthase enzyme